MTRIIRSLAALPPALFLACGLMLATLVPAAAQADRFGAIAYAPASGITGWGNDYSNRSGAEDRAMRECRSRGGQDCRIAVWFRNGCGALARGSNGWGSGWGTTEWRAATEALQVCSQHTLNCTVHHQICTGR